jgi:diketogulonate reductase-like aldo/keto reductase
MRTLRLRDGKTVSRLGLGTWRMGERRGERKAEVAAVRLGIESGMTLVDTAEMYGEGGAEEMLAEAATGPAAGLRDRIYLVSKVYPHNASRKGAIAACERSLQRLATDRIDLYLLHWRGSHPLADTVAAFEQLRREGKIGAWGVSNFDADDMAELAELAEGGNCAANQVLYHPGGRGIEWDVLPDAARTGTAVMAYSPLGQGRVLADATLAGIARKHAVTPAAVSLAFVMRHPHVLAIPKATRLEHVRENMAAADLVLDAEDLAAIDKAFPPPRRKQPLAIL